MRVLCGALTFLLLMTSTGLSQLKLSGIFNDHAVLQRDKTLSIWGTAKPEASVSVSVGRHAAETTADADGRWRVDLPPQPASNLQTVLRVVSAGETIVRTDILFGDVWHASGQSNMAMTVQAAGKILEPVRAAAANADLPEIRFARLTAPASLEPKQDAAATKWVNCTPTTVESFSAVAFFFAKRIHSEVGVPIGIIDSSRGGTPIEPFIPRSAFSGHPTLMREGLAADKNDLKAIWAMPGGVRARDENWLPGRLFNSRIAPIADLSVHGCIWYQGESNCGTREDPREYRHKMAALINGWRDSLGQDLPFYFVQLPGSGAGPNWPYMREQQRLLAADSQIGGVGMAVTIDLEHPDIHPPDKITVGERLARWALRDTYGKLIQASGPMASRFAVKDETLIVQFDGASFGLRTSPDLTQPVGEPKNFEMMNADGFWYPATARIVADSVHVTSSEVSEPRAVRYAYSVSPQGCNLFNSSGLPASPFCSHPELLRCSPDIPSDRPLIIAHRGASHAAPENTLAAFRLAFAQGADGVEADFHLTSDNKIVCIHDATTGRVADEDLVVADSTLAQLKALDVGSWKDSEYDYVHIPTLEQVVDTIPEGKLLYIELKTGPEIIAPLAAVLQDSSTGLSLGQCVIISFRADTLAEAKRQLPDVKTQWLSAHRFDEQTQTWSPTADSVIKTLRQTGADAFGSQAKVDSFDAEFISKLTLAGYGDFHVWTVNDSPIASSYADLGVRGITTDRPAYIRETADRNYVARPLTDAGEFTDGIEGPACDKQGRLYAVNFDRQGTIGRVDGTGQGEVFRILPAGSVGNGIRFDRDGTFFVADYTNHNILRVDPVDRRVRVHAQNTEMNQPNDLAITSDGILFASDPNWEKGTGQLWRIDPDGTTTRLVRDMGTTNGVEVSPDDKTLYVNESKQRNIWAFRINANKTLSNKRLIKRFQEHGCDGMRCDVDGNLYVTRYGKGTVVKLSPTGEVLREIELPGSRPSNICFGGPDGRTAFVTEVDNAQIVSFRVEKPGVAWLRPEPVVKADPTVRVFIFAGQSNMVGSDSKTDAIHTFPPFRGLQQPQPAVKFSYCIGRENKLRSNGWVDLAPVNNVVGPELSFARKVSENSNSPIAIIKCAAGGTHLGGDWNPDDPQGFRMYPLALELVRESLADLTKRGIPYRLEGFMWHQGENDMFQEEYRRDYGQNLANFLASWRRDLNTPDLKFYIGELCCKTIWGMDLRPRMYDISLGQRAVTRSDKLAEYVPTSHVGVEIGSNVGLHYHYGTLGQLEHGVNYADAYLRTIDRLKPTSRKLVKWPYEKGSKVKLFVMAGHRNMEGERAFTSEVWSDSLKRDDHSVAYRYSIGGGYKKSDGWEPLGHAGFYNTFGPEITFVDTLKTAGDNNIAIAKFTHSGTQINDWTPAGTGATSRNVYLKFIGFVRRAIQDLEARGHEVEVAVFYHAGENDMSFLPYRREAANRLRSTIQQSRKDLKLPNLEWFVSQQKPTDFHKVNAVDVVGDFAKMAKADPKTIHIKAFDLPHQEKMLVLNTFGVTALGEKMASDYIEHQLKSEAQQ